MLRKLQTRLGGSQIMLAERCQTTADLPPRLEFFFGIPAGRLAGPAKGWPSLVPQAVRKTLPNFGTYVIGKAHPSANRKPSVSSC